MKRLDAVTRRTAMATAAAVFGASALPSFGQGSNSNYPNKTIRLVAPFAPGGAADTVGRIITPKLSEALGQQVIIDNRTGASGAIGSAIVAAAPADGYTLLINLGPPHQTVQFFSKGVKYDPVKDFTAISLVATAPQAVVVPMSSPIKSISEYVAAARKSPIGLSYGTAGIGTSQHLAGLLLASTEDIKLTHVGYRGGAPALTDLVGSQIDSGILVLSNSLPFIQSGKLRALGVVESHRSKSAPTIPTLAEGGLAGFSVPDTWVGVLGPVGLPEPVVTRLTTAIAKVLQDEGVRRALADAGYDVVDMSQQSFSKQLADSTEIYKAIVAKAGIQPE
jgi:tripartite-type tricarboxylate transporter receptor subunit TctC